MHEQDTIFKEELINGYLDKFSEDQIDNFDAKWDRIQKWKYSCEKGDLTKTKETSIQGLFLNQIFGEILGYTTLIDGGIYNQIQEFNSTLDGSEADGALGFFSVQDKIRDIRVAIELKGADVPLDKKQNRSSHLTPVEQGMSYANKNGSKCGWVIVSNFIETRLYKSDSSLEYETFDIRKMDDKKEFLRFYFLLCRDHLINDKSKSLIDRLYQENEEIGVRISNEFYSAYKEIRTNLYKHLQEKNPDRDEITLFTKSQKIMDRFTFICFCEDCGLLPANTYRQLIDSAEHSFSFSQTKLWDQLRGLFTSIDQGNPPMNINRYNGGLFREDKELDSLVIEDDILKSFLKLSDYNFSSDLNVNILGQIFEQSISDVEQIKNEILGVETDAVGKQKEDGIFYTPYYVTRYIVENTVGAYLNDQKEAIKRSLFRDGGFKAQVFKKSTGRTNTYTLQHWEEVPELNDEYSEEEQMYCDAVSKLHLAYWTEYEDVLRTIKICDPSCGSGAFLNQCFDFLKEEMDFVLDMKRQFNAQITLFDIDKEILQNNLYGVDINQESVEITKLSLWLKTAKSNQTLASLDDNIKCGNSIIDDPDVAGDLAFNWSEEFPEVFANGGFNVVVGNPPYGATLNDNEKEYISSRYKTTEYNFDTYKTFMELGIETLSEGGYLGYITPSTYFVLEKGANRLRKMLFEECQLKSIVELFNVFDAAIVEPAISVYKKQCPHGEDKFRTISVPRKTTLSSTFVNEGLETFFKHEDLWEGENYIFNYHATEAEKKIKDKIMSQSVLMGTIFNITTGVKPYQSGKGTPKQTKEVVKSKPFNANEKVNDTYIPYMKSGDVRAFTNSWRDEYISYGEWLAEANDEVIYQPEYLLVRQTGDYPIASYFNDLRMGNNSLHFVYYKMEKTADLKYGLAFFNSKLLKWLYQYEYFHMVGKPLACVKKVFLDRLPIKIDGDQSYLISIVDQLLERSQSRFDAAKKFTHFIELTYHPRKISEKILYAYELEFDGFLNELKKQRVRLSASEKMSLMDLFLDYASQQKEGTKEIEKLLDDMNDYIYKSYSLTEEEIEIIEGKYR